MPDIPKFPFPAELASTDSHLDVPPLLMKVTAGADADACQSCPRDLIQEPLRGYTRRGPGPWVNSFIFGSSVTRVKDNVPLSELEGEALLGPCDSGVLSHATCDAAAECDGSETGADIIEDDPDLAFSAAPHAEPVRARLATLGWRPSCEESLSAFVEEYIRVSKFRGNKFTISEFDSLAHELAGLQMLMPCQSVAPSHSGQISPTRTSIPELCAQPLAAPVCRCLGDSSPTARAACSSAAKFSCSSCV